MAQSLKAGFGVSCITPPLPCRLAGFARRRDLSRHVAQQLWARSVVLDDGTSRVAWVVCDILEVSRDLVADVRSAVAGTGCVDGENVMVGATHTHAGPDLSREWSDDEDDHGDEQRGAGKHGHPEAQAAYRRFLPHAVASSVVAAVTGLVPSTLSWGEEALSEVGTGRRDGTSRPQRLGVLTATAGGRTRGMRVVFPCHATVLGPSNLAVSGDVVGAAVEAMEAATGAYGGCSWAQGAAGDISTRWSRRERTMDEARRLGDLVASAAGRAAGWAAPLGGGPALALDRKVITLPQKDLAEPSTPGNGAAHQRDEDDRSEAALIEEGMVALRARQSGARQVETEAELCLLSIGELKLCFVPGEPFESIERSMAAQANLPGLRVVGYSNGAPGYIFSPDEEAEGGYEILASPLTGGAGALVAAAGATLAVNQAQPN